MSLLTTLFQGLELRAGLRRGRAGLGRNTFMKIRFGPASVNTPFRVRLRPAMTSKLKMLCFVVARRMQLHVFLFARALSAQAEQCSTEHTKSWLRSSAQLPKLCGDKSRSPHALSSQLPQVCWDKRRNPHALLSYQKCVGTMCGAHMHNTFVAHVDAYKIRFY